MDKGWNRNGKKGNGGAPVTDTASGSYRAPPFAMYTQVHRKTVLVCWSIKTPQAPLTERGFRLK